MANDATDRTAYVALGMLFGVAAGVGAGMLLAPRSGRETREQIREHALDAKRRATAQIQQKRQAALVKIDKAMDKSKQLADKAADRTKDAIDKTSQRAKDAADQAQTQARTNRIADAN